MPLTRYYHKKRLEAGHIRAVRDLLKSTFDWGFASASYSLFYPAELYSLKSIDEVDKTVAVSGQPDAICFAFKSSGGRQVS